VKAAILSFLNVRQDTMVVSTKIARYVADALDLPVVCDESIADQTDLDVLVIVNGAYGFCKFLQATAPAIETARRVVWVQNDYTIIPPKPEGGAESPFRLAFRKRKFAGKPHIDYWTTLHDNATKTKGSSYVNWNCLTFDHAVSEEEVRVRRAERNDEVLYYGAFRNGRQRYFDRYFLTPHVATRISSPSKKFVERYASPLITCQDKIAGPLSNYLGRFRLGLYLEDKLTHSQYMSPANRFYEMLSAGLPMVFQPECGGMMRRAGYDPEPYFVPNSKQLSYAVDRSEKILAQQREEWLPKARQSVCGLDGEVLAAWKKTQAQL
jgi:hypothetical protein